MPRLLADVTPLRNEHFGRLWAANIVTVIGAQLTVVTVPAQIYAMTSSSGYVGLAGLFGLVPLVIFGLYGGALTDHFDKRLLLQITTLGLITTSGAFFVQALVGNRNVWLLLSLFALQQAFFGINQPARVALIPDILSSPSELPAANSLNMTVFAGGSIAGPLIAGVLIPLVGYPWLYLIDTLTLTATLYAVWRLPRLLPRRGPTTRAPGLASVVDGFRYLGTQPVVLMSFVVDLIAMVFGMPRALFPAIAHLDFGGPTTGGIAFALLYAAVPAGAALGGLFSGWVSTVTRHGRTTILAVAVWGLGVAIFGWAAQSAGSRVTPWLVVGVIALAVAGAADMVSSAFRQTILLSAASEDVRGRLQGVFVVVVAGGPRIADVLHGAAADTWGTDVVVMGGGLLVLAGLAVATALVPSYWRYRPTASVD